MLIDIHTHHKEIPVNHVALIDDIHFIGVHPWFIDQNNYKDQFEIIKKRIIALKPCLIGETGLDRLKSSISYDIQEEIFLKHLDLALELKIPVVIHCLKAHSDFLRILKINNYHKIRFLIHDYSGGEKELKEYLKHDIYFSFGRSLFRDHSKAQMVFKKVPIGKIFLETDDSKEFAIDDIYGQALKLRPENDFESVMLNNFLNFFNYTNDISSADFIKKIASI